MSIFVHIVQRYMDKEWIGAILCLSVCACINTDYDDEVSVCHRPNSHQVALDGY